MKSLVVAWTLLLPLALGLTLQEDDIVFDDIGEEATSVFPVVHRKEHETPRAYTDKKNKKNRVEKLWGVPDARVVAGHVLKLRIPKEAFGGSVDHYEVHGKGKKSLPHWIHWDDETSTFLGVPSKKDVGQHHVIAIAHGKHGDVAKDSFIVRVEPEKFDGFKHKDGKTHCKAGEEQTLLTITLNSKFDDLKPTAKVEAIENLAGFLGLHTSSLSMHTRNNKDGAQDGAVKSRKEKYLTSIQWQIGCDGRVWSRQADILGRIPEQARDGTLAEVLQLPVLNWRVKTYEGETLRERREAGSGDYGNNDDTEEYDDYDDNYDDSYDDAERGEDSEREYDEDNETITEIPSRANVPKSSTSKGGEEPSEHPHRHHHGEETIDWKPLEEIDEHEIAPVVNQRFVNGSNGYSTIPIAKPTTPPQTSTASSAIASSASMSATIRTASLSTSVDTLPPQSPLSTAAPATTEITTKTTTTEIPMSSSITQSITSNLSTELPITIPVTRATTTTITSTLTSSVSGTTSDTLTVIAVDSPRSNAIDETADRTNFIGNDYDNNSSTSVTMENNTLPTPVSSSITTSSQSTHPATSAVITPSEKMEATNTTSGVYVNVTEDEPTEITEGPTNSTPLAPIPSTAIYTSTTSPKMPAFDTTAMAAATTTIGTSLPETIPMLVTNTTEPATTVMSVSTPAPTTEPPTTTTTEVTTIVTTTTASTTTTTVPIVTTDTVELGVRNFPPRQDRRLKKISVTAGKPLSYIIPYDTFSDVEDGDTRKLRLSLYLQNNPVKTTHWLQLNPNTQEIYGLPLENDVSRWDHELVASDSEGLNVTETLDIYVQQHKFSRSVNHEFSIYLKIEKRTAFPYNIDWELKVVRSLAQLYGDNDPSQITVRMIDITQDQAIFTWTNDSVPRSSECPKDIINGLLHVLIADKDGEPSDMLINSLGPEIRVKRVVYQGIGQCETMKRPETPKTPTQEPKTNFAPMPRNQVDLINATVGQLLVYKVPDDTFFDPEDGSAYNMQMALLTNDRAPIPPRNWLQFDVKNREFYGVPLREDIGRKEYQLVVTDKEGASATDGMVVIVQPAPFMRHSVEFSMTLAIPYDTFAHSAMQKRSFVEKLAVLFQDKDTSAISLDSITEGSTVVTWRNLTIPTKHCPNDEISRLSEILVKSDKSLTDRIEKYMGEEFPVKQITLTPMGMCLGQLTGVHSPDSYVPPSEDSTSIGGATSDDYLITFVLPAVIIAAMLVLAGIIACVLYRRRRSGKMSVSEQDDERQSFRSKGIPVIFQDELEEKPDPGNKSPVILKEEKPPLPPPEYQKAEDGADVPMLSQENSEEPYQRPPPFAENRDNNRQNRPKPTPTYRTPPPYVPP